MKIGEFLREVYSIVPLNERTAGSVLEFATFQIRRGVERAVRHVFVTYAGRGGHVETNDREELGQDGAANVITELRTLAKSYMQSHGADASANSTVQAAIERITTLAQEAVNHHEHV